MVCVPGIPSGLPSGGKPPHRTVESLRNVTIQDLIPLSCGIPPASALVPDPPHNHAIYRYLKIDPPYLHSELERHAGVCVLERKSNR